MKKILITGYNGFLGSHLLKELLKDFYVIGLEKNPDKQPLNKNFTYYESDSEIEYIFEENEIFSVIHLATLYRLGKNSIGELLETNLNLPLKLMQMCNKYNVNLFINTDSFFNDKKYNYSYLPIYTLSKKNCLEWLKLISNEGNCKLVNMKIFHMFGENDSNNKFINQIISKIKKNNEDHIDLTDGIQKRDFIYVLDVVAAFVRVIKSFDKLNNKFYNFEVGTGRAISVKNAVKLIKDISKSNVKLRFGVLPKRKGEILLSCANNSALKELGWNIEYSFENAIKRIITKHK